MSIKTVYLFDTENEGSTRILAYLKNHNITGCDLYLFYTDTNKKDTENLVKQIKNNAVHEVHCEKGSNALDIQLIAYMGLLLKKNPDNKYIIVSKDTDFEPAVRMLVSNDIKVSLDMKDNLAKTQSVKKQSAKKQSAKKQPDGDPKIHRAKCALGTYIANDNRWSKEDKDFIAKCAVNSNGNTGTFDSLLMKRFSGEQRQLLYKELTDKGRTELLTK